MSIDSESDLEHLKRVGAVVAEALAATAIMRFGFGPLAVASVRHSHLDA